MSEHDWEFRFNEKEQLLADSHNLQLARILAIKRLRSEGFSWRDIGKALELSHEWCRQLGS